MTQSSHWNLRPISWFPIWLKAWASIKAFQSDRPKISSRLWFLRDASCVPFPGNGWRIARLWALGIKRILLCTFSFNPLCFAWLPLSWGTGARALISSTAALCECFHPTWMPPHYLRLHEPSIRESVTSITTKSSSNVTWKTGNDLPVSERASGKSSRNGSHVLSAAQPPRRCGERSATCRASAPPWENPPKIILCEGMPLSISAFIKFSTLEADSVKPSRCSSELSSSPDVKKYGHSK